VLRDLCEKKFIHRAGIEPLNSGWQTSVYPTEPRGLVVESLIVCGSCQEWQTWKTSDNVTKANVLKQVDVLYEPCDRQYFQMDLLA
jgi:hypothetical protein